MADLLNFILSHEEPFKSKARLTSLYSDFSRLKNTNPDGYKANVSAWISALTHASFAGFGVEGDGFASLTLRSGPKLESALEMKSLGIPLALETAVSEAVKSREFVPLQDFFEAKASIYQERSWLQVDLPSVWQVAQWGLQQIGLRSKPTDGLRTEDFVVLANVESAAQAVMKRHAALTSKSLTSEIYSLSTFTSTFSTVLSTEKSLSAKDISILLMYMARDKAVISTSQTSVSNEPTTIKFTATPSKAPEPVTSQDTTIAQLHTLHSTLSAQIQILRTRIDTLSLEAREHAVDPAKRSLALSALRKKKLLASTLQNLDNQLTQVETLLSSIDEAATQRDIVNAVEASTSVLKDLNKQIGGAERVDRLKDELREEEDHIQDVAQILQEDAIGPLDEAELDEELEKLQKEQEEKEVMKKIDEAPDVPVTRPQSEPAQNDKIEQRLGRLSLEADEALQTQGVRLHET